MFTSTEPIRVIGVPRQEFFAHLILIKAQILPASEWIPQALSLMIDVESTESTAVADWDKTYEQARARGELPACQVR